jgi:hypothetical protein
MDTLKICATCGVSKPLTAEFFQPYPRMRTGFRNQCRSCVNAQRRERYRPKPSRRSEFAKAPTQTKVCTKCGETKRRTAEFFPPDVRMVDGFRSECKACRAKYRLEWRNANPQRNRAAGKRHYLRHRERYRAWGRAYLERNRDHLNAKGREYM